MVSTKKPVPLVSRRAWLPRKLGQERLGRRHKRQPLEQNFLRCLGFTPAYHQGFNHGKAARVLCPAFATREILFI